MRAASAAIPEHTLSETPHIRKPSELASNTVLRCADKPALAQDVGMINHRCGRICRALGFPHYRRRRPRLRRLPAHLPSPDARVSATPTPLSGTTSATIMTVWPARRVLSASCHHLPQRRPHHRASHIALQILLLHRRIGLRFVTRRTAGDVVSALICPHQARPCCRPSRRRLRAQRAAFSAAVEPDRIQVRASRCVASTATAMTTLGTGRT